MTHFNNLLKMVTYIYAIKLILYLSFYRMVLISHLLTIQHYLVQLFLPPASLLVPGQDLLNLSLMLLIFLNGPSLISGIRVCNNILLLLLNCYTEMITTILVIHIKTIDTNLLLLQLSISTLIPQRLECL